MKKMKLVMVGNGMAGVRTLEELLKIAPDLYDITVFGAEPHPNYNRILLSPVLAGEQTTAEIILNPLSWYEEHGITLHLGKTVTQIDRVRRRVIAAGHHQFAPGGAGVERRARLQGKLVERQVVAAEVQGFMEFGQPIGDGVVGPGINHVEGKARKRRLGHG